MEVERRRCHRCAAKKNATSSENMDHLCGLGVTGCLDANVRISDIECPVSKTEHETETVTALVAFIHRAVVA